jgi:hypothetical protein
VASLTAVEIIHSKNVPANASRPAVSLQRPEAGNREPSKANVLANRLGLAEPATPEVIAHSVEFVAWPGKAGELRTVVPEAMRSAFAGCANFSGCLVL